MPNTIAKERNDKFRVVEEKQHQFLKPKMPQKQKRNPRTIFTMRRKPPVWRSSGGGIGNERRLIASTLVQLRQALLTQVPNEVPFHVFHFWSLIFSYMAIHVVKDLDYVVTSFCAREKGT